MVGDEDTDNFVKYTVDLSTNACELSTVFDFKTNFTDKQKRTDLHQFFKRYLTKYESDTLEIGSERKIRCFMKAGISKKKRQKLGF